MLKKIPQLVIFCGLFLNSVSVSAESERFILNSMDWNKTEQLLSLKEKVKVQIWICLKSTLD